MSKRLERLNAWIQSNPYEIYGDYRDTISDEQAAMLIAGEFTAFNESIWEWELSASDYAEWHEWESEFAAIAGYDEWSDMPEWLQEFAMESRYVDCSDMILTAISNWQGHVTATPIKRNGDYIEFQGAYGQEWDAQAARYLKRHCGIDPKASEPTYAGTYLKALGTLDLWAIYQAQRKPTHVLLSPDVMTIGHEPLNGSGTTGKDQYKGKPRFMPAIFRVDSLDRYGVDAVFGLTGECWSNELTVKLESEA